VILAFLDNTKTTLDKQSVNSVQKDSFPGLVEVRDVCLVVLVDFATSLDVILVHHAQLEKRQITLVLRIALLAVQVISNNVLVLMFASYVKEDGTKSTEAKRFVESVLEDIIVRGKIHLQSNVKQTRYAQQVPFLLDQNVVPCTQEIKKLRNAS